MHMRLVRLNFLTPSADYPRTLREWSRRFQQNFDDHIKVGLQTRHPDLSEREIEIFRRKWICESRIILVEKWLSLMSRRTVL
jgi:cyclopropane-fatty-acyl-phospholipid synthase